MVEQASVSQPAPIASAVVAARIALLPRMREIIESVRRCKRADCTYNQDMLVGAEDALNNVLQAMVSLEL